MERKLEKDGPLISSFTEEPTFEEAWEAARYKHWGRIAGSRELPDGVLEKTL